MNYINNSFMLALSYRLTVAVNMSTHGLESLAWKSSWNDDMHACAEQWKRHLLSSVTDDELSGIMVLQFVNEIVDGLSKGYESILAHALPQDRQDVYAYTYLLNETRKLAHAPAFADWGRSEFFVLGQQLAQNDLRTHFSTIDKPELPVVVSAAPEFTPLSGDSFPPSWADWPTDPVFNECLNRYIANRRCFVGAASFFMGALTSFALSIMCPSHFPSTVWCWQDWEKGQPWRLFLAGGIFHTPALVTVKDLNDKAVIGLFEAMDRDKREGRAVAECGWMPRNSLWPKMTSNTRSKAWSKLTRETLTRLGEFDFNGGKGKNRDTGGKCRLPAAIAEPTCRIFIEKRK